MHVLMIRHVHAGDRASWEGDDRRRPISPRGEAQARDLVERLGDHPIERVLSSDYDRCVQSVEPLAAARGLPVGREPALAEGAALDVLHRLLRRLGEQPVALCSHGDVIGALIIDLEHRGVDLGPDPRWPKASVWVLEGAPEDPRATYLPPTA